jgi:hypothetical protein
VVVRCIYRRDVGCVLQLEDDWRHCVPDWFYQLTNSGKDDGYISKMKMMNEEGGSGDIVSLNIKGWVDKIRNQSQLIAGCNKEMEPWKKRELTAAIICGENLVNIRKTYSTRGDGFKAFVETEFKMEFCYKTAVRFMKLFHGKDELKDTVTTLQQAYKVLGIVKEQYAYPKEESNADNQDNSNPSPSGKDTKTKPSKGSPNQKRVVIKTMPEVDSILIPRYHEETKELQLLEFNLDSNGKVVGRELGKSDVYVQLPDYGLRRLQEYIERFIGRRSSGLLSSDDRFNADDDSDISFSE